MTKEDEDDDEEDTAESRGGRWTSLDASFARCFAIF